MAESIKRAWELLLPSCVKELVQQDSFGLGPEQHVTADQFYDILQLWWNQELKLANINQLPSNHLNILREYSNKDEMDDIANYLGFYQPKNGVCGFVAGIHAILLYKIWDQVINHSMQQMNQAIKPQFDLKQLMISSITHALITAANTASNPIKYKTNYTKKSDAKTWICKHCQSSNATQNVFCKICWKEPNNTDNAEESTITIDECHKISIVTDGELSIKCCGFNTHYIDYDPTDEQRTIQCVTHYLSNNIDFETNFISEGCCIRILLSLILTHGIHRCEYELLLQEYDQIHRQFRDESLILGPFGFCSQNLVNLTMFGHCKPVIDSSNYLSYPYGFLGHDVINPGATGFFQTGYGYEYPLYPIWVVLSGTHYTTLFALPTHIEQYNDQHIADCYHDMVKWMHINHTNDWKCINCGKDNDNNHVICGGCFSDKSDDNKYEEEAVHFEVDLLCYNGLPPSGPLLAPISIHIITEKENIKEKQERERVIKSNQVISIIDHDEMDETKKLKYIRGHALVQKIQSKQSNNVHYYEIAISLEPYFEDIQYWKSPYFMKLCDQEWKKIKAFFDPKILPHDLNNSLYEYPSIKWRCCSCYLGDDMMKKYAGFNELENGLCKACAKPMYEGLRTLIVKYEHVPPYIRESKIDKVYQNAMVKLLKKRFRNLIVAVVNNDCLPVI